MELTTCNNELLFSRQLQISNTGRSAGRYSGHRFERVSIRMGGVGQLCLGESQSRLYPHMRAKFWRGPKVVSKKVSFKFISRFHYYRRYAIESTTIFVWKIDYYLHNVCFTDFFFLQISEIPYLVL